MKNRKVIFCLMMLCCVCMQAIELPIYSLNSNNIVANTQFIDQSNKMVLNLNFETNNMFQEDVSNTQYSIKTGRFNGWQNEPGDYDVIQFFRNSQEILLFRESDGIVKLNNSLNLYSSTFNNYSRNGRFIVVEVSPSSKALIFLGQHYGTDVAKLIIFILTETEVKLVYCKKMMITSIANNTNSFSMTLQSNILEGGQGQPIIHTIWKKDGILFCKDN